jgi:DNA-binding NarL/FixJ family response regulator
MRLPNEVSATKIGVLIADHDVLACRLLASRLRKHKSFEVAECTDPSVGILDMISKLRPSVAVISTVQKDAPFGGLAILREARNSYPAVRSVALLDNHEKSVIVEAFRSGAKGVFVRADYDFATLCKCLHRVHQGHIWADSRHLEYVLDAFSSENTRQRVTRSNGSPLVSKRERDVMRLVVDGLSNREIATQLGHSEHTVKNYVFRLFEKLGVYNRVELVHYALAHQEILGSELAAQEAC